MKQVLSWRPRNNSIIAFKRLPKELVLIVLEVQILSQFLAHSRSLPYSCILRCLVKLIYVNLLSSSFFPEKRVSILGQLVFVQRLLKLNMRLLLFRSRSLH